MSSSDLKLKSYHIPLEEIKMATNSFSQNNCIGVGGFGKVYKGELSKSRSNRIVAIKRLDPNGFQGKDEFRNELRMLSSLDNKNIITFIGYCDDNGEMLIVYEYASNRSLDHHLRNPNNMCRINWLQRLKICVGAARGLDYLHSGLGDHRRIIHRDMKSANILLDENLEAKISDFGLSRAGPRNQPLTFVHTSVAGTNYYLDPYYHTTRNLNKESDVYSFGVILFELLCGRLVYSIDGPLGILEIIQVHKGDGLEKILDPYLKSQVEPISLRKYTEVAYRCIKYNYKKRPTMGIVVKNLEEALKSQEDYELEEVIREELYSFIQTEIYKDNMEYYEVVALPRELYSFIQTQMHNENKDWEEKLPHNYKEITKSDESRKIVSSEVKGVLSGLGVAGIGIFVEFENAVMGENSKRVVQGCEIHPLTRCVMKCMKLLVDYSNSLNTLLRNGEDHDGSFSPLNTWSPIAQPVLSLITSLESNLEEKSGLYDDNALPYIFLMNNIHFIVQEVKDSELRNLLGDQWNRKLRGKIWQYHTSYLRTAWGKALLCLKDEGIGGMSSRVILKERLKSFNACFEDIYRIQSAWKVPDTRLREELVISISEKVIPAYRSFVRRFGYHLESGRHAGKYMKYKPDDLENYLWDLFEGTPAVLNHMKRKIT